MSPTGLKTSQASISFLGQSTPFSRAPFCAFHQGRGQHPQPVARRTSDDELTARWCFAGQEKQQKPSFRSLHTLYSAAHDCPGLANAP